MALSELTGSADHSRVRHFRQALVERAMEALSKDVG